MLEGLRSNPRASAARSGRLSGTRRGHRGRIGLTPICPQVIQAVTTGAPQGLLTQSETWERVSKEGVD